MNRSQVMNTIAWTSGWDEVRENEIAVDRAMEYVLDGRL